MSAVVSFRRSLIGSVLTVVYLAAAGFIAWTVTNSYYVTLLLLFAVYAISAFGLNIVAGYAGQLSIGQGAVMAAGAYTSAVLTSTHGWSFWAALPAAIAVGLGIGFLIGIPSVRMGHFTLAMVTAFFAILTEQMLVEFRTVTGGHAGIVGIDRPAIGSDEMDREPYVFLVFVALLIAFVLYRNFVRSRWSTAFVSLRESEIAATSLGLPITRLKLIAFVLSAVWGGFAGVFLAHGLTVVNAELFQLELSLFIVLILIIGGRGTLYGPLLGAVFLTVLPEFLKGYPGYELIIYGSAIVLFQLLMPNGLVGLGRRLFGLIRSRDEPAKEEPEDGTGAEDARGGPLPAALTGVAGEGPPGQSENDRSVLDARGLRKRFGGTQAVDGVHLMLLRGSVHGLIGPNGSGKTTTLNLVSGFYGPDEGHVLLEGERITGRAAHRIAGAGVGRTFQTPKVFPGLTVLENVMAGCWPWQTYGVVEAMVRLPRARRETRESRERAEKLLAFVGLGHRGRQPAAELTHVELRSLEIARSLAGEPSVLLLDEPAAGLSRTEIHDLERMIRSIADIGVGVVLVEHRIDLVFRLCDVITVLDHGAVIGSGEPAEIRQNPDVIGAYLGTQRPALESEQAAPASGDEAAGVSRE